MHNSKYQCYWQHAAHTTDQLLLAAKQAPLQKSLSPSEKYWKNFLGKVQQNGPAGRKKDKTERVTGLSRRTRKEIVKWNQMTALGFQTGGGDIRHPRPPLGGNMHSFYVVLDGGYK